jgi:hypothetical protein
VKKRNVIETVTRYINGTRRIRGFESLGNSAEARKDTPLPPGDTHRPCHHCDNQWKDKLFPGLGSQLRCTSYTRRISQWRVEGCTTFDSLPTYRQSPLSCPWAGQGMYILHVVFENFHTCNAALVGYLLPINYCFCKANDNSKHKELQQSWKFIIFSLNLHNIEYLKLKVQS